MTDWNAVLEVVRLRLHHDIDRRAMLAQGMDARHVNRSLGQRYTRPMLRLSSRLPATVMALHGLTRTARRATKAAQELADAMRIGRPWG